MKYIKLNQKTPHTSFPVGSLNKKFKRYNPIFMRSVAFFAITFKKVVVLLKVVRYNDVQVQK
jgi:hypothetical protein